MTLRDCSPPAKAISTDIFDGLLSALFNAVPEGVLIVNSFGEIMYINEQMRELWGFPDDMPLHEAQNFAKSLVINPEQFTQRVQEVHVAKGNIPEETVYLKNGKVYARNTKPLLINGTHQGRLWTYKDVTEKHQTRMLLVNMFDLAPIGIALVGFDGTILQVNKALEKTLGYSEKEFQQRKFSHLTHPDDLTNSLHVLEDLMKGSISHANVEKRFIHKN